jgi:hypothetical protein
MLGFASFGFRGFEVESFALSVGKGGGVFIKLG